MTQSVSIFSIFKNFHNVQIQIFKIKFLILLITLDYEISMVFKKIFYEMHRQMIEIFNLLRLAHLP